MLLFKPKFESPIVPYVEARHQGGSQNPSLVVVHSTVSSSASGIALRIANMWHGPTSPVSSAHYTVDAGTVIQSVHDHVVAYHCGYNADSLGLEMCDDPSLPLSRWESADHKSVLQRTAELTGDLLLTYGIPARFLTDAQLLQWSKTKKPSDGGISTHVQMSRVFKRSSHWDPGPWPSEKFLSLVKAHMAERQSSVAKKKVATFKSSTVNIKSFPTLLDATQLRKVFGTVLDDELIGTQECDEDFYKRKLLKKFPNAIGMGKLDKLSDPENSCALIPATRAFMVLGKGSTVLYNAPEAISKDRRITYARLQHKKTGLQFGAMVLHGPVLDEKMHAQRMQARAQAKETSLARARKFLDDGLPVVVLGDFNDRDNWFNSLEKSGFRVKRVGKGIDQQIFIDGPKTSKWTVVKTWTEDQPSDHDTLTAKVKLTEK